jgi:glutathione reductase (NADPH)
VALAEESRMGGTCVIRGCVPKKLMVFASGYREGFADARAYGWDVADGAFDWTRFRSHLNTELDRLEGRLPTASEGLGRGHLRPARDAGRSAYRRLADGSTLTAKHILIATGGRPERPGMPNDHLGIVSDDIFNLEELPKRLLIVGGGYIACEFACILNGLGVEVTQFYRGAQILRGFDGEARGLIAEMMQDKGIDLHLGTNIVDMAEASADDVASAAVTGGGMSAPAEASGPGPPRPRAGRSGSRPRTGTSTCSTRSCSPPGAAPIPTGWGLRRRASKLGRRGQVVVDEYSQTAVPSIYAIGDVTNRVNLTPVAIREGMAFVETVFSGNPTPVDHDLIPSAVFTQPEFGTVGLSEEEAREQEPVDIYCTSFRPMQSASRDAPTGC